MKTIRELLLEADPLKFDPAWSAEEHGSLRQKVLAAASAANEVSSERSRVRIFAVTTLMVIVVSLLSFRVWSPFISNVQAAVHFEMRLAEEKPAPGLHEAKVAGSDRSVYLHDEVIVDNEGIAEARVVQNRDASHYDIAVKFNASVTGKIRAATGDHIGRPVAIILDGSVVMAPVVRSPMGASAIVTGNFTKDQAEKIANGIERQ